uniref:Secreted protein n=1 Tax=Knipowitschia caucasica TaxID=637954 RepID=A0AAV2J5D8_KNICA
MEAFAAAAFAAAVTAAAVAAVAAVAAAAVAAAVAAVAAVAAAVAALCDIMSLNYIWVLKNSFNLELVKVLQLQRPLALVVMKTTPALNPTPASPPSQCLQCDITDGDGTSRP